MTKIATSIKLLGILRNTVTSRLDICLNEKDGWFRIRQWELDAANEIRLKETGISPEEMAELIKLVEGKHE